MLEVIQADLKKAMLERNTLAVDTLKMLKASLQNAAIDAGSELDEAACSKIIKKESVSRAEAAEQYEAAGKTDMAEKELAEKAILDAYLPQQLTEEEIGTIVDAKIAETGASSMQDMGKVMDLINAEVAGRADGGTVAKLVKEKLSS